MYSIQTSNQRFKASIRSSKTAVGMISLSALMGIPSVHAQEKSPMKRIEFSQSTDLLAGNSDSADPFFSNDGERLYFLSSADNLTRQAPPAGEVIQLFQWSPESDEVSQIHLNPGNGIPRLGGVLEILESQDGSGFYFYCCH